LKKELENYILAHTDAEPDFLQELGRQTHVKILLPRMLSGHLQGRILKMLTAMLNPKRVLEIGTYTGYSALCIAEALGTGAKITTIDINDELESFTRSFFDKSEYAAKIEYLIGDALQLMPTLTETFDLIFIDGDKRQYAAYYEAAMQKLKPGGFIWADNVLWDGKVLLEKDDAYTDGIKAFNKLVQNDVRVENLILPIRDGIMMIRKK